MSFFAPLLTWNFWFDAYPSALSIFWERTLFAVFGLTLIVGAIIRIIVSHRKADRYALEIAKRIASLCINMGVFGIIIFFFAYQQIPVLGARFWFLIWGIGTIVWIAFIVRYAIKEVPKRKMMEAECQKIKQYLPTGKKKKKKKKKRK